MADWLADVEQQRTSMLERKLAEVQLGHANHQPSSSNQRNVNLRRPTAGGDGDHCNVSNSNSNVNGNQQNSFGAASGTAFGTSSRFGSLSTGVGPPSPIDNLISTPPGFHGGSPNNSVGYPLSPRGSKSPGSPFQNDIFSSAKPNNDTDYGMWKPPSTPASPQRLLNPISTVGAGPHIPAVVPSRRVSVPDSPPPAEMASTSGPPESSASFDDTNEPGEASASVDASLLNKILHTKLNEIRGNDIFVQRKDPSSPLYSMKKFEDLNLRPELLKGVFNMGFTSPSKIQEQALPLLLCDPPSNMIAQSQSGTGKTAAFVLAALSRIDEDKSYPQVICLSPTYELALQTGKIFEEMSKFCNNIAVVYAVKGERVSRGTQLAQQIIIGTPGTLLDWTLKFRVFDMRKIRVFILDEADVMMGQQGHRDQCIRLHRELEKCQQMLFSATYDDEVMEFAENLITAEYVITVRRGEETLENIKQYYVQCHTMRDKYQALINFYGTLTIGQCVIFCHTRRTANWLSAEMTNGGHSVGILTGELDVTQRAAIINRFRKGDEKILISTNVTARGIDVEQVNFVVNFDLPMTMKREADYDTYLHRIGRTGRFGKAGIAINFVDSRESMDILRNIETHFKRSIEKLDATNLEELEKIET